MEKIKNYKRLQLIDFDQGYLVKSPDLTKGPKFSWSICQLKAE